MPTEDGDDYQYDGYLLFNELCLSEEVSDQELTKVPATAEAHLLEEYLPRFEPGDSENKGKGFEPSDIRNHTNKLTGETADFIDSLISLRYREEDYEPHEAEVDPDEPRQTVKIPEETSADVFWSAPNFVYVRGADGIAETARTEFNSYLKQAASVHSRSLKTSFLLWLFEKIYRDEQLTDSIEVSRLTHAKVEGGEDFLGKEQTVKESSNAKEAPVLSIGLLLGKSLTKLEGDFRIPTNGEDDGITARVEITTDKIHIKTSKTGFGNKDSIEKIGYSTRIAHEIVSLFSEWRNLDDEEQVASPELLGDLLLDAHENDIDLRDKNTILDVFDQYATRRGDVIGDYDLDEALELLQDESDNQTGD
jgi:hypothetical protein